MSAEAWEREFWGAIETILKTQDESLESWLGGEHSKKPATIVEQADEALYWAVKNRVVRCKEDFAKKYQDPKRRQQVLDQSITLPLFDGTRTLLSGFDEYDREQCPACGAFGFSAGTLWSEEVIDNDPGWTGYGEEGEWLGEPPTETVEKTFSVEEFLCTTCGFRLFGTKEVAAADLPEDFTRREEREREFEPDYGND
jgi:hypothetical protein